MSNEIHGPYGYDGKPRNEGNGQQKPPNQQPMNQNMPVGNESSPMTHSTYESFSLDYESSPIVQSQQPNMPHMKQTSKQTPKSDPKSYNYSTYGIEEKQVQVDMMLFAAHPMHQCPNICEYVKDCMLHCERMMNVFICRPDSSMRRRQIALLQDCSEVCFLTTRLIARRSPVMKTAILYCAKVCRLCGQESMRYPDAPSQACARMCFHCAAMCEQFTEGYNWD